MPRTAGNVFPLAPCLFLPRAALSEQSALLTGECSPFSGSDAQDL